MRQLLTNKYYIALVFILFAVFWIWWIPGLRVANDFAFVSNDWLKLQLGVPQVWNERGAEGLGEYGVFTLWSYPINLFFGILTIWGLNFEVWERILVVLFIFLGSYSIWQFLSTYNLSNRSKFIGGIFYLVNTYSILLIDGGQISIALAYGLFPLVVLRIYQSAHLGIEKKLLAGLFVAVLGFFDFRFIFITLLLLIIKALFDIFDYKETRLKVFWRWINTGLIIGTLVLAINAFWLIAQIRTPLEKETLDSITKISTNFVNIGHAILVISPHWYKNIFGRISQLKIEFILLPILAFLAPVLKRKDKQVLLWTTVALFSIFLTKGESEPLPQIYPWLHAYIPGFYLFRDSTKFFFLLILSYSVLIAFSSEIILKKLSKNNFISIFLVAIVIYLLYLIKPVFLNQMTGSFSIQPYEKEFQTLSKVLKEDKVFGRVFWIPGTAPLSYSNLSHTIVEAARIFNRVPFEFGVKGAYETFNFLREAPYMGEVFDVAGISYVAYPSLDPRRDDMKNIKYYNTFLNQLTSLPWIEKRIQQSEVPLLKTKTHQDKIFIASNLWVAFGTDDVFSEATKSAKLKLSNNAIIFAEYKSGLGPLISQYPEAKILLSKKTNTDLLATFIPESKMIFPARQLAVKPDENGWWKNDGTDLISWRDFLQSKYGIDSKEFDLGGGWAVGEGKKQFTIRNLQFKKGKVLLARVMESSRSGSLKFDQSDEIIGNINTRTQDSLVRWFQVGVLQKDSDLTIKTEGDINVINALALLDPNDLSLFRREVDSLKGRITDFKPENAADQTASISYKRVNQTLYKVSVANLANPQTVVFSSAFHPLWQLDGENAIPVYGFLNGFRIEKNGDYILAFKPQENIKIGLIVSTVALVAILCFFFLKVNKRDN